MSMKRTALNKQFRIPHYLKPTSASLAKRVPNRTESPSRRRPEPFRSYSRCNSSTFSSSFDLSQKTTRSTSVQPNYTKRTKSSRVMQKKPVRKREEKKTKKLRDDLKNRAEILNCDDGGASMISNLTMTRRQSDAPSTADSALSVPSTKRPRIRKREKPLTQLETCYSLDLPDDIKPVPRPPIKQMEPQVSHKTPVKVVKHSEISHETIIEVINRITGKSKVVIDLFDIAILIHKRNEVRTSQRSHENSHTSMKFSQVPATHLTKLKSMLDYSKDIGSWAWGEFSGSRSLRAVAAWAVLNLAIHFPSWLRPSSATYPSFSSGFGIFSNSSGLESITSHVGIRSAASISMDLLRSALVILAAI